MFRDKLEWRSMLLNGLITLGLTLLGISMSIVLAYFDFNEEAIVQAAFWIATGLNALLSFFTFLVYRFVSIKKQKKNDKSYRKIYLTHSKLIDWVKFKKLKDKVLAVIIRVNFRRREEAYNKEIQTVTGIFNLEELFNPSEPDKQLTDEQIRKKCHDNQLSKKSIKRLFKAIKRIKTGKVYYVQYTEHQIMTVPQDNISSQEIDDRIEYSIALKEYGFKTLLFFILSGFMASVRWKENPGNIFNEIIARLALFASSMLTAVFSANFYMGRRKERIKIKNDVIQEVEEIDSQEVDNQVNEILNKDLNYN